jgi:5-methylcytosine-specific restriction endonuclease McrA
LIDKVKGVTAPIDRLTIKYAAIYYFLSELDQYVSDDLLLDRYLSDYFETAIWDYIVPFRKWTALHMFSSLFADIVLDTDFSRAAGLNYVRRGSCKICGKHPPLSPAYLLAADLCHIHDIDSSTLDEALEGWVLARDCCRENGRSIGNSMLDDAWFDWKLQEGHDQLLAQIAEEMFFVLFANRSFLRRFNQHMADRIGLLSPEEGDANLVYVNRRGDTRLVRADPPDWAKRTVFFRDRGYCCGCGRNLENSRSPINRVQFDHILPLAAGGMNDVTNLQLLCESCNGEKSDRVTGASEVYERWYKIDRDYGPRTADTLESVILELFADKPES